MEDRPDGVVDAEGWLGPGEELEEDGVLREMAEQGLELLAEVDGSVGAGGVGVSTDARRVSGGGGGGGFDAYACVVFAYPCVAW